MARTEPNISQRFVHEPTASTALKTDRRIRKTKEALRNAVFSLIVEKGYDAVTVQDILDRANVGRSTFYNHFVDKQDVFRSGFESLCDILQQRVNKKAPGPEPLSFSLELYRQCLAPSMRRLYTAIYEHPAGVIVMRWLSELVAKLVRLELPKIFPRGANVPDEALVQFVVGSYIGVLRWSMSAPDVTPEQLDAIFRRLIAPLLSTG